MSENLNDVREEVWDEKDYFEINKRKERKNMKLIKVNLMTIDILSKSLTNYSTSLIFYFNMIFST